MSDSLKPSTDPISKIDFGKMMQQISGLNESISELEKETRNGLSEIKLALYPLILDNDRNKVAVAGMQKTWEEWKKTLVALGVAFIISFGGFAWALLSGGIKIVAAKGP